MNLDKSLTLIKECAARMNELYGRTVFDEWAVVHLTSHDGKVLAYIGPRKDDFQQNFSHDLGSLREEILNSRHGLGDFEFARHGFGTHFEAFLVLGNQNYLVCNNTTLSMTDLSQDPRWLSAQVPFVELSDNVRTDPLTVAI